MDRLILLVGASGSGKTAIAKEMEKVGYNVIQSYTTRSRRRCEEWGHEFVNEDELMKTPIKDIIAFQEVYDGVFYWATREQYEGLGDSIYIVCPDGAEDVRRTLKYNKDVKIITIYLQTDEYHRWERMMYDRVKEEVDYRLEKDNKKFQVVKCDYTISGNDKIHIVVNNLRKILEGEL